MGTGWSRNITGRPETREERAAQARRARILRQAQIRKLDRKGKAQALGKAIAAAAVARGMVSIDDCIQAGFTEADARDLYAEALPFAHRFEPRFHQLGAQP